MATRLVVVKSAEGTWAYCVMCEDTKRVLRAHGGFTTRRAAVRHAVGG